MKQYALMFVGALLAGASFQIEARELDSLGDANYFYIEQDQYEIGPDNTVDITFRLDNENSEFNGFKFDLYLPEGFVIKKDDFGYFYEVNSGRNKKTYNHDLVITDRPDGGFIRILCLSLTGNTIATGDDWIISLTIQAPDDYSPIRTAYTARVADFEISDLNAVHYMPDFTFDIICGTEEPSQEPAYADSQIDHTLTLGRGVNYDFYTIDENLTWTSSNNEIFRLESQSEGNASNFGHAYVVGKDADNNEVAVVSVYVCPTLTVIHPEGSIYTHHVLYKTYPTVNVKPGEGYKLVDVTHDGSEIADSLIDEEGYYISTKPITENSVINLSLEQEMQSSAPAIWSDSQIRVYVDGYNIHFIGVQPYSSVNVTGLDGITINKQLSADNIITVEAPGIYILTFEDAGNSFKVLVK